MKWKDTTSYSRNDTERKPTAWSLALGCINICVTCNHVYHKPEWVVHCFEVGIDTRPLAKGLTAEMAQSAAIAIVKQRLQQYVKALDLANKQ